MSDPGRELTRLRIAMAAPTVGGLLAVALAGSWFLARTTEEHVRAQAGVAVAAAREVFVELVRVNTDELGAALGTLAADRELTAAVAARDPRRILAVAGPRFHALRVRQGVTHWNYWEPEPAGSQAVALRNVVRIGTPTLRGDLVERTTLARVAREKSLVSGMELGYTGFVLRVLAPVRDGGRVVGYAELGRDVGTLLRELQLRTGDRFALVLDKHGVDPRRWASARAARGERDDWGDREGLVLVQNPTPSDAVLAGALPPDALPDGGTALDSREDGARLWAIGAFPVLDAAGRKTCAIYVLRDVSELGKRLGALRRRGLVMLSAAVALAMLAMGAAFEWLVVRALRRPN